MGVCPASPVRLFQEAHDSFLYGFDTASIALCRSLLEQALKDRLPRLSSENRQLGTLSERADRERLLVGAELEEARNVLRAGNEVMHDGANLRRTAQEVLLIGSTGSIQQVNNLGVIPYRFHRRFRSPSVIRAGAPDDGRTISRVGGLPSPVFVPTWHV